MKKIILVIIAVILSFTLSIIVFANYAESIQAIKVQHPIIVNNTQVEKNIPMISIEDRIYLPIRAMCEVLDVEIDWNEEGRVEIIADKSNAETTKAEIGYYGIEGWTVLGELDFELSKETALAIADDLFLKMKGKEFVAETSIKINETDDGMCYVVYRCIEPPIPGESISVIIRKSDGKILRIEMGE